MTSHQTIRCLAALLLLACAPLAMRAFADVLVGQNGERFVGKIVEETADSVVFESGTAGKLVVPRSRIRGLERLPVSAPPTTNQVQTAAASPPAQTNAPWVPPELGQDGFDWLKLKSNEWLKGHLRYVQDKRVHFDSDKLEELTFELKDVRYLYSSQPMFVKFENRDRIFGAVILDTNRVEVVGPEQVEMPRDQLTGIAPGGKREIDLWSGKINVGFSMQAGNTKQANLNATAELARRTPATQFLLTYFGNFSEVEGEQNANNHRANLSYDVRLNRNWFARPVQVEYYRDVLANIAHRGTVGVGLGYYFFDRDDFRWKVAAGPGYQYTKFETVATGQSDHASTPAAILQSNFEVDLTSKLTFIQNYSSTLASKEAGLYSHHLLTSLEFEIKHSLDLNISFVWDYLERPQQEASGQIPQHSDLRLTAGVGVKF